MIYVRIKAGLGNQLFQYALARNLSLKHGTEVVLDLSWYRQFPLRSYELDYFNIKGRLTTLREGIGLNQLRNGADRISRVIKLLPPLLKNIKYEKERQLSFEFEPAILDLPDNIYLDGVWQMEKYFKNIGDVVKKDFTLKNKPGEHYERALSQILNANAVAVHVRRGDLVTNKKTSALFGTCPVSFYREAVEILAGKIKEPVFFVFSDDIGWAKENLKLRFPTHFVSNNIIKDQEELILMSKCRHDIIADSTFSWWGAWLNENPGKIIIAPKEWVLDPTINTKDVIPEGWLRI